MSIASVVIRSTVSMESARQATAALLSPTLPTQMQQPLLWVLARHMVRATPRLMAASTFKTAQTFAKVLPAALMQLIGIMTTLPERSNKNLGAHTLA